jgi:hypothetical protein
MKAATILHTIGNTPHIRVNRLFGAGREVWIKSERANPGGSIKDRIALAMVEDAERSGRLKPGGTIIEPTSGNTGIGLAMVAAVKGYALVLVMPDSMSIERRRLMLAYGARFELTPREKGMKGSIARAQELAAQTPGSWIPQQFENPANIEVHARTTAREILDKGAVRIQTELADQPAVQATLMDTMGTVYTTLGLYGPAVSLVRQGYDKRLKLWGPEHAEVASSLNHLGEVLRLQTETAELLAARAGAKEAAAELQTWQTQQRGLNLELAGVNDKARRSEQRLYSGNVKNPKELTDLQNEIEALGRRRAALEDEIIEAMIMVEDVQDRKSVV